MPSITTITVAQAARLIGTPAAPLFVDVCLDEDFARDPRRIPGAIRHAHQDIEALAESLIGRSVILYCQKGGKISQGAAALLRCHGVLAETLEGGQLAWAKAGQMLIPESAQPGRDAQGRSLWVSRHRPKIERIACPWLIRRFVDPAARFLFVAPSEVLAVAERFDATAFDVDGAIWSHRGDHCTFDTMLDEWSLSSSALQRMATIIRGADTNRPELAPEVAGLLALSLGLSRLERDDLVQLETGLIFYDALYRWARDAADERHVWPDRH